MTSTRLQGGRARDERGFTLIEMMIVVAVIAVLALVVVPTFFRESRKTKAATEVAAFLAEIQTKEEQYKSDSVSGTYLSLTACPAALPPAAGVASSACGTSTEWTTINIDPPQSQMRCQYTVLAGAAGTAATGMPAGVVFTAPSTVPWYIAWATCDGDNSAAVNAIYYATSVDSSIKKLNEGQ